MSAPVEFTTSVVRLFVPETEDPDADPEPDSDLVENTILKTSKVEV